MDHKVSTYTAVLLVAVLAWAGVWDVFAAWRWGYHETITYVVRSWDVPFPPLRLVIGFILGHIFWGGPQGGK